MILTHTSDAPNRIGQRVHISDVQDGEYFSFYESDNGGRYRRLGNDLQYFWKDIQKNWFVRAEHSTSTCYIKDNFGKF
jgi:hypothetical protein